MTLAVSLGPATLAHPAVNAVKLYEGGAPVPADCQSAGPNTYRCLVGGARQRREAHVHGTRRELGWRVPRHHPGDVVGISGTRHHLALGLDGL